MSEEVEDLRRAVTRLTLDLAVTAGELQRARETIQILQIFRDQVVRQLRALQQEFERFENYYRLEQLRQAITRRRLNEMEAQAGRWDEERARFRTTLGQVFNALENQQAENEILRARLHQHESEPSEQDYDPDGDEQSGQS